MTAYQYCFNYLAKIVCFLLNASKNMKKVKNKITKSKFKVVILSNKKIESNFHLNIMPLYHPFNGIISQV